MTLSTSEINTIGNKIKGRHYTSFLEIGTWKCRVPFALYNIMVKKHNGFIDTVDYIPDKHQGGLGYNFPSQALGESKGSKEDLEHQHIENIRIIEDANLKNINLFLCGSDEYFKNTSKTFDCILIDGAHYYEQVKRDLKNSAEILNVGGTIFLHDYRSNHEGVDRAVSEFDASHFKKVGVFDRLFGLEKLEHDKSHMHNVTIIAEIGINHNGDMKIAKKLIDIAKIAGVDLIKFQKRDIDKCYSKEFLSSLRKSPWGDSQRDQKLALELTEEDYNEIDIHCKERNIKWFASAWDIESQKFLQKYNLKYNKVASPMITNIPLLKMIASEQKHTFISTGMSSINEIESAVEIFRNANCPFELMHCVSEYPLADEKGNLNMISVLKDKFDCDVGYSDHSMSKLASLIAVGLGASSIERHITSDKTMYGSDQSSSLEERELLELVNLISEVEDILGDGIKIITEQELINRKKLKSSDFNFV